VFYVGDRIKQPGQLNGKSANLNHVLLHKIYPTVRKAEDVPLKDMFMVMDCDHMVRTQPHFLYLQPQKSSLKIPEIVSIELALRAV
jgi:hypothetical protein